MGDRGNIKFVGPTISGEKQGDIYLYTHWCGYNLPAVAQEAVRAAKPRWRDGSYANRIAIQKALDVMGATPEKESGFGISTYLEDNEHPIICLDLEGRKAWVESEEGEVLHIWNDLEDFLAVNAQSWEAFSESFPN